MSIKRQAVGGALWTIGASVGGRAVGLVATLALTHYLTPHEYGAVSVAAVAVATAGALSMLGLGQYVVAHPDEGDGVAAHVTCYHLASGLLALWLVWLLRPELAGLFDTPELERLLPGIVLAGAIDRVAYTPGRVLARDMRFNVLAARLLGGELAYAGVSVALVMHGFGAMSLVWGTLARAVVAAVILVGAMPLGRWLSAARLSLEVTRRMFSYSLPMAVAGWLGWLARRGDNLLIAGMFGPAAAGQYNMAYNLADIPATQIGEHIGDVLLPSFAKMRSDGHRRRALTRASGLLALVVFPLAVGLGAVAPTLVRAMLGQRWWSIAPMLVVLSVLSILRPVGWLVASYLQAVKRTRTVLLLEAVKTVAVVALVLLLGQLGVLAACAAIGLAFGLHAALSLRVVFRDDGLSFAALLRPLSRPLLSCLPMAAVVVALGALAERLQLGAWLGLGLAIGGGAATYVLSAFTIASHQARDLVALLRGLWAERLSPS